MAKMKKIRKWDEVTGNAVEEQIPESIDPIEDVGAGPSISRNHMRGIEDMVEQNDNSFDGIINNVPAAPVPDFAEINEKADQEDSGGYYCRYQGICDGEDKRAAGKSEAYSYTGT